MYECVLAPYAYVQVREREEYLEEKRLKDEEAMLEEERRKEEALHKKNRQEVIEGVTSSEEKVIESHDDHAEL